MAFEDILNQEIVKKILQGAVKEQRIAHSYLFTGSPGIGKWFTAIEFAKMLNCLKVKENPRGECLSCKKINRLAHPDLRLIFPLPPPSPGKKSKNEKEKEEQNNRIKFLNEKISSPYKIVKFEKPGSISIDEMRSAQRNLLLTPVEGRYKVLIVQEPEKMSTEAQNCFLKTLEEPPKDSLLLLLSSEPEKLLSTMVSRCQRIRFSRIKEELIAGELIRSLSLEKDKAFFYARLSEGSIGKALSLAEEDKAELRSRVVEFLKIVLGEDRVRLIDFVSNIVTEYERESILEFFSFLSGFLRDIFIFLEIRDKERILDPALREEIEFLVISFDEKEKIQRALELTEKIRLDILGHVNSKLALLNLGFEFKNITKTSCGKKLFT